jgi:hypothetical protein
MTIEGIGDERGTARFTCGLNLLVFLLVSDGAPFSTLLSKHHVKSKMH